MLFGVAVVAAVPVSGQGQQQRGRTDPEQLRMRNQIVIMEGALKQAVRSGAGDLIEQLKIISFSAEGMLLGDPEAQGFRLPSYGLVFFVRVPRMNSIVLLTLPRVVERQVAERQRLGQTPSQGQVQAQTVGTSIDAPAAPPVSPTMDADIQGKIRDLPAEYRRAIVTALIDAMLDNGGALRIPQNEYLVVAARRAAPPDPLDPSDDVRTTTFSVKGETLEAYQQKRMTREEARKLIDVREE